MDNEEFAEKSQDLKPGFSLIKYGHVLALNFNEEFAQRLLNILADSNNEEKLSGNVLDFYTQLGHNISNKDTSDFCDDFEMTKFYHVYNVSCNKEFSLKLNQVLTNFLAQKRVSPALFSFAKQLEGCLYPKRFDTKGKYADE